MIIRSGLSDYVTNISDMISLYNLAKATGPYLLVDCHVFLIDIAVFRFDVQIIDPLTGKTYLEISRIRTNWLDMDTEVNYPIVNVIKQWRDESIKLPYDKSREKVNEHTI